MYDIGAPCHLISDVGARHFLTLEHHTNQRVFLLISNRYLARHLEDNDIMHKNDLYGLIFITVFVS